MYYFELVVQVFFVIILVMAIFTTNKLVDVYLK